MIQENARPAATPVQHVVHSPGPWRRDGFAPDNIRSAVIRDATGFEVANARSWINEQYEGNANLVAAAPDLLKEVTNAIDVLDPAMSRQEIVQLRERLIRFRASIKVE